MIGVVCTGTGATTANLTFSNFSGATAIHLQISSNENFEFAPAPIYILPANAIYVHTGLNQRARYFCRARTVASNGALSRWGPVDKFQTDVAGAQNLVPASIATDNAVLLIPELLSFAVPQPHFPEAGYPISNLISDAPNAYMSTGLSGSPLPYTNVFNFYLGRNVRIDTICLLQTNLPEDSTVLIRSTQDPALAAGFTTRFQGNFRASQNVPGRPGYHGIFRFEPSVAAFWRIEINSSVRMLFAQHIAVGLSRISKFMRSDKAETPASFTTSERQRSGSVDRVFGAISREVEFDLANLPEAQHETLYQDLGQWLNRPVLGIPNSKAGSFLHDRILYGDLLSVRSVNTGSVFFNLSLRIKSII